MYQPQWDVSGTIVGAEALLRWESGSLGPVSPGVFIPLAEETGQIHAVGEWVIESAAVLYLPLAQAQNLLLVVDQYFCQPIVVSPTCVLKTLLLIFIALRCLPSPSY